MGFTFSNSANEANGDTNQAWFNSMGGFDDAL
jgi:hypothetical protein